MESNIIQLMKINFMTMGGTKENLMVEYIRLKNVKTYKCNTYFKARFYPELKIMVFLDVTLTNFNSMILLDLELYMLVDY